MRELTIFERVLVSGWKMCNFWLRRVYASFENTLYKEVHFFKVEESEIWRSTNYARAPGSTWNRGDSAMAMAVVRCSWRVVKTSPCRRQALDLNGLWEDLVVVLVLVLCLLSRVTDVQ